MYRHALPPGFVLKSQKKKTEDDALRNQISLEEFLEVYVSSLPLLPPALFLRTVPTDVRRGNTD